MFALDTPELQKYQRDFTFFDPKKALFKFEIFRLNLENSSNIKNFSPKISITGHNISERTSVTNTGEQEIQSVEGRLPDNSGELA